MAANERVLVRTQIGLRSRALKQATQCCPRRRAGSGAGPMQCRPHARKAWRSTGRVKGPQAGLRPPLTQPLQCASIPKRA